MRRQSRPLNSYPALEREGKTKTSQLISVQKMLQGSRSVFLALLFKFHKERCQQRACSVLPLRILDATATKTEKGNFFKIEAETSLTEQAEQLRREGRLQMITGRKVIHVI